TRLKAMQRAAKAPEQRVVQLEAVETPQSENIIRINKPKSLLLHNKIPIMANRLTLPAGHILLLDGADFQLPVGRTIDITGENGSGKTTLLHHILQGGEGLTISPKAVFGVYEQMDYQFTEDESVLGFMKDRSDYEEGKIRAVLHSMDFTRNDL